MALEDFAAEMDRCSSCSYCKWIPFNQIKSWRFAKNCPSIAYHNFNSYSARGRYLVARSLLKGQSDYNDTVRRVVYTCLWENCTCFDPSDRFSTERTREFFDAATEYGIKKGWGVGMEKWNSAARGSDGKTTPKEEQDMMHLAAPQPNVFRYQYKVREALNPTIWEMSTSIPWKINV